MKDIVARINVLLGYNLPIENDEDFFAVFEKSNTSNFDKEKFEKDFYLTILLHRIAREIPEINFKGGTCLNRVYFPYFRLSEDLDFSLSSEDSLVNTHGKREKFAQHMREKMKELCKIMGRKLNDDKYHHKSAQGNQKLKKAKYTYLKYVLTYLSIFDQKEQTIKIEITYTNKQHLPSVRKKIQSIFIDPLLEEHIFQEIGINCLSLEEMMAEKVRAALTRKKPAIRDFFDIRHIKNQGFDFLAIKAFIIAKIVESGNNYTIQEHYESLKDQITTHLRPVLGSKNGTFDFDQTYNFILSFKE